MSNRLQFAGIIAMTILAAAILFLIGHTFDAAIAKMTPDGRVPLADAGLFTALLLSFREVLAVIKAIGEHADRKSLTQTLSGPAPTASASNTLEGPLA